jgi:hypothetical protein
MIRVIIAITAKGKTLCCLLFIYSQLKMFVCYQVVHHNDGKIPSRTAYVQFSKLPEAINFCHQMNQKNHEGNLDKEKIAITYHFEYVA